MADFYHIMVDIPGAMPDDVEVRREMDKALSWYRYRRNCWIGHTTSDAKKWAERLGPLVGRRKGRLFVAKLDIRDRQGLMSMKFWDWLNEHESGTRQ